MRAPLFAIAPLLIAASCAYDSPHARRSAYQKRQVERLRAAPLPESDQRQWRAVRPLRVRVYAGPRFRRGGEAWRSRVEAQFARANDVLRDSLGVRLDIETLLDWEPRAELGDMDATLEELRAHDPARDVDFVVGLVGSLPRAAIRFRELGIAQLLGSHIVLRDMDDVYEQQAISENLDTLSEDERVRLYRERREHKETVILLHELGHALGALHVDAPETVMYTAYDNRMRSFAAPNVEIMKRVLAHRAQSEDERDLQSLVQWLSEYVEGTPWEHWPSQERAEYARLLREALQPAGAPAAGAQAAAAATAPAEPAPEHDVSALPEPAQARFAETLQLAEAGDLAAAWAGATALAQQHPDSYPVQHLACELAMRTGRRLETMRQHCNRAQALAAELP